MSEKDSSDEEDVFECGRCKEKFTDMKIFVRHKKEKSCQKVKKRKSSTTKESAPELGGVHESILISSRDTPVVSPMRDQTKGTANITSASPTISELFTSKGGDKEIETGHISLELLSSLGPAAKPEQESATVDCVLCQEWFPDQQTLENHHQEKHGIFPLGQQVQLAGEELSEVRKVKPQLADATSSTEPIVEKPVRRTRPQHSCSVCNLKFLSKFKLEQHAGSRKHRNAVKKSNLHAEMAQVPKRRPGRPARKGVCSICGISTNSVKELQEHLKEAHKKFGEKENSGSRGKRMNHDQSTHLCRECGQLVPTHSLKRHERRCANRKRFECPLCKHQSRERTDYTSHVENHKVWIRIDRATVRWDGQTLTSSSDSKDGQQTLSNEEEHDMTGNVSEDIEKEDGVSLSPSDLAMLGLMPKPQSKYTTMQDCLDALASGLKGSYDEQLSTDKEFQNENEDVVDNPDDNGESSATKLNSKQLKCKVCKKWFLRKVLSKHMYDIHSMVKQFQCRDVDCLTAFTDIDGFKEHVSTHSKKLMFQCGCRQCLPNKIAVEEEYADEMRKYKMRQYYAQLSYKCRLCWMKFATESRLMKHQLNDPHRHECDQCGKVVVSKRQLRLHKESHQNQRGYLCDMCGSGFKTDRDLKRHIASHGSVKPYECEECGKAFLFKNKLKRHQNTVHATHKPYACDYEGCKKSFARKDKLRDHKNTHKSPAHICQYCPKTFHRKDVMKEHEILAHTKEYPYLCKMCEKGFLRPKVLESHQANEHNKVANPTTIDNLLKASASVQRGVQNAPVTAAAPLSYVIYDQNITSVLQGATDTDGQPLQLQSMTLTQASTSEAPSGGDLTYQMTDITGAAGSGLTYQMSGSSMPDPSTLQVSLSQALEDTDHVIFSLKYKNGVKSET